MAERKVTIAAANMLVEHDTSMNMAKIVEFIEEAAKQETRLLVLPECCLQGYLWTYDWRTRTYRDDEEQRRYFYETAETIPGRSTERITKYAKDHDMLVQVGMVEKEKVGEKTLLHNAVALVGPSGLVGVFRKIHSSAERIILTHGRELLVFETFLGKIGPIICADLKYPETVRVLALKGAEIITMSTAWGMDPMSDQQGYRYDLLSRANALMNGVWMVAADQTSHPKRSEEVCFGHSRIIDPDGNIVAGIGYEEGLVTARVDIKGGMRSDRWSSRCPECYAVLSSVV